MDGVARAGGRMSIHYAQNNVFLDSEEWKEAYKHLARLEVATGPLVCLKVVRTNGNGRNDPHQWRLSRI